MRKRNRRDPEFELLDTGVFEENRYFDVQVEYAKEDIDDIAIRITVTTAEAIRPRLTCCRRSGFVIPGRG